MRNRRLAPELAFLPVSNWFSVFICRLVEGKDHAPLQLRLATKEVRPSRLQAVGPKGVATAVFASYTILQLPSRAISLFSFHGGHLAGHRTSINVQGSLPAHDFIALRSQALGSTPPSFSRNWRPVRPGSTSRSCKVAAPDDLWLSSSAVHQRLAGMHADHQHILARL